MEELFVEGLIVTWEREIKKLQSIFLFLLFPSPFIHLTLSLFSLSFSLSLSLSLSLSSRKEKIHLMLFDDMIMWMVKQKLKDTYLYKGNIDLSVALVRPKMG